MNDEKTSSTYVKDGIKLLQKRSNPVELFVQKRVRKDLKKISSIHLFFFSWII